MAEEESDSKPKRRVRKASPKPRGRSPGPPGGKDETSPTKKGGNGKKKPHVPPNPGRGGSSEDNNSKNKPTRENNQSSDSQSDPKKEKPNNHRAASPKRNNAHRSPSPKRNGTTRGRSPENSRRGERKEGETSARGKRTNSPKKIPPSPKRSGAGNKPAAKKKSSKAKLGANVGAVPEPSIELKPDDGGDETESSYGDSSPPRYVSPKGHSTGLQLDVSKMGLPVFSILDDNSLLGGESTDGEKSRSTSPKPNHNSLLHTNNNPQKQASESASSPTKTRLEFTPWGMEEQDDDDDEETKPKKAGFGLPSFGSSSPSHNKATLSPMSMKRAVKAFKYTKPSTAGAANMMGKLNDNFKQRLGLAPLGHEQMRDEDDLASLL